MSTSSPKPPPGVAGLDLHPRREHFFELYNGQPPWEIHRPQEAFVRLCDARGVRGSVLDVGCGSGENALLFAARGHEVWAIDMVPKAIDMACAKAEQRGLEVTFRVADALALETLGRSFDTVIDSALFHVFSDSDRLLFVASLARVLASGGMYYMLCFSDEEPGRGGPRRISQDELRDAFRDGWEVCSIEPTRYHDTWREGGARAWLATIARTGHCDTGTAG
ncbi:MAG: class I SAM-dependent methyltransferase [Proteobacteria bacterium]|nr:class I SAM-dependent methyltransferase [Pseudomonadota bacterium]